MKPFEITSGAEWVIGLPIIGLVIGAAWILDVVTGTKHLSELYQRRT